MGRHAPVECPIVKLFQPNRNDTETMKKHLVALLHRSSSRGLRWCPRTAPSTASRTGFVHQEKASTAILSLAEEICIVVRISLDRCVICAPVRSLARRRGPPCRRCSSSHRPTRWTTQRDCSAEPITIFRSGGGPLRSIAAIIYILCDGKARARQKSVRWWCSRSHLGAL